MYKKAFLSFGFILVSIAYAAWQQLGGGKVITVAVPTIPKTEPVPIQVVPQEPVPISPPVPEPTPAPQPDPAPAPAPTPTPVPPTSRYTDGAYPGNTANAYYGLVKVQVVIQGGQLVDVKFLQYPNDRNTSRYINSQAMPLLTEEALQAQDANVDIVSGATFTSQAFRESLASALAQAKN